VSLPDCRTRASKAGLARVRRRLPSRSVLRTVNAGQLRNPRRLSRVRLSDKRHLTRLIHPTAGESPTAISSAEGHPWETSVCARGALALWLRSLRRPDRCHGHLPSLPVTCQWEPLRRTDRLPLACARPRVLSPKSPRLRVTSGSPRRSAAFCRVRPCATPGPVDQIRTLRVPLSSGCALAPSVLP